MAYVAGATVALDWRIIAGPTVDGYTRARLQFDPHRARSLAALRGASESQSRFWRLIRYLREPETPEQERARKNRQGGFRTAKIPLETVGTDDCIYIPEQGRSAEITVSGLHRQIIQLHWPGLAFVTMNVEYGILDLQFKAKGLWRFGYQSVANTMISALSRLCLGKAVHLQDSRGVGWKITGLELCCDFIGDGFYWERKDADNVLVFRKTRESRGTNLMAKYVCVECREILECPRIRPGQSLENCPNCGCVRSMYALETGADENPAIRITGRGRRPDAIEFATRQSNFSMIWYGKTNQIIVAKDGEFATYLLTWNLNGANIHYDAKTGHYEGPEIHRVEMRMKSRALKFTDSDKQVIDLTDPWALADIAMLRRMWAYGATKYRLVDLTRRDGGGEITRPERAPIDDRWKFVLDAGSQSEKAAGWIQDRNNVAQMQLAELYRKAAKSAILNLTRVNAMTSGHFDPEMALAGAMSFMEENFQFDARDFFERYREHIAQFLLAETIGEINERKQQELDFGDSSNE